MFARFGTTVEVKHRSTMVLPRTHDYYAAVLYSSST